MNVIRSAMYRLIKPFLLMALSLILITACYQPAIQKPHISAGGLKDSAKCRVVQHELGETCVPIHPQRVVVLDEFYLLDHMLALGIKPIGFARCPYCIPSTISKFVADVPVVGQLENPSIEKILRLKPDLILGLNWQASFYPLLSKIAPTVMIEPETEGFKIVLKHLAEILDKGDRVEKILGEYNSRIQKFQQQLGEQLQDMTVSVVGIHGSSFYVYKLESRIYSQIMSEAGIRFIPTYKELKNDYTVLSIETLPDWDADLLFILQNYERHSKDFEALLKQPIWSTLKAVQNKQAYAVTWDVSGAITANQFINQLYKYFSDAS